MKHNTELLKQICKLTLFAGFSVYLLLAKYYFKNIKIKTPYSNDLSNRKTGRKELQYLFFLYLLMDRTSGLNLIENEMNSDPVTEKNSSYLHCTTKIIPLRTCKCEINMNHSWVVAEHTEDTSIH